MSESFLKPADEEAVLDKLYDFANLSCDEIVDYYDNMGIGSEVREILTRAKALGGREGLLLLCKDNGLSGCYAAMLIDHCHEEMAEYHDDEDTHQLMIDALSWLYVTHKELPEGKACSFMNVWKHQRKSRPKATQYLDESEAAWESWKHRQKLDDAPKKTTTKVFL